MSTAPGIDPRGPRTAAWITTVVLAVVLLTHSGVLLALQALVFALGARGLSPYGLLYKKAVRPRLAPLAELEAEPPTRFAQVVGLAFAVVGAVAFLAGAETVGVVSTAFALAASFLIAAFGLCLGCELYLIVQRTTHRTTTNKGVPA